MSEPVSPGRTDRETAVVIVGAGMSGLIAARALHRRGIDVLVLESAARTGGRLFAETSALGSRLDLGGQWVGAGHHRLEALAAELGATVFPMHTPKRPMVIKGGKTLSAVGPTVAIANAVLASWVMRAKFGAPRRWSSQTIQDRLSKVPPAVARRLLEVLLATSTTADLDRFSMESFVEMIGYEGGLTEMLSTSGGAQDSLILEGAGTLTDRIAAELGERVLTDSRVISVRDEAGSVVVSTESAVVRASKVIVSVPPPMTTKIAFDPPLPVGRRRLQDSTYMGSVYKAIAVYERPFWREHADLECMILDNPGAAVFDTSPPGGPGHLCVLVGGREAREIDALAENDRRRTLIGPLAAVTALPALLDPVSWHEKSWHRDENVGGGYSALPSAGSTGTMFPLPSDPTGDIYWTGTETAAEHAGYIEGAIEAGERVAAQVIASLR
ncbi:flavin monoamine oxidase family protein [[Mycobacterium] vasticus]|uniref:NAD(P)/FAD-dependent oxidoreductase n=1 Tax=[Mycobacterium] vasticus TaxID=2875777 RepID=A0ABU5YRC4_9MYCO|nr:NAD(P)/FAD-dependent oxidoreductase [Mycolicibacter sp. MYC017]MEB3067660.1 NAD(P)/FAD-dependent oxidoreductase [Mycolicibacter sp. MYC017]